MKTLIVCTFVAVTACCVPSFAQNTRVEWSVFDMGYGVPSSTTSVVRSVAGQMIVGSLEGGNTRVNGGFLVHPVLFDPFPSIFAVTTTSDTGAGSLRRALETANAAAGLNIITFNIPGGGVHTITPSSPLPEITEAVIIDGYTQPGASPNTNGPGLGSNAVLLIELNGINSGTSSGDGCLKFRGSGNTVRGLVINRAPGAGIVLYLGGNNIVEGNFIGTDPTGAIARPNYVGVLIEYHNDSRIGGTSPASRNVISGNTNAGISIGSVSGMGGSNHVIEGNLIGTNSAGIAALGNGTGIHLAYEVANTLIGGTGPGARNIVSGNTSNGIIMSSGLGSPAVSNNMVQGNFIGTDVTGTAALGNAQSGVTIYGLNNTVGGAMPGARNVISANGTHGVHIFSGDGSAVQGNYIGTDTSGTLPLGNRGTGVTITAHRVRVGGTAPGEGNTIAFNGTNPGVHAGVAVTGNAQRNSILGNSIFSNVGLGIDLGVFGADGVTANDPCDADTLVPNNYQNFPVLTSAQSSGGNTVIGGTLDSKPYQAYRIEFFSSPQSDSTQYGEGKTFLGSADVVTNAGCAASFSVTFPVSVPTGHSISATATDTANNTSEFSRGFAVGTTSVQQMEDVPKTFELLQNYPNPFNPTATIRYALPTPSKVTLKVYDVLGEEVATLTDGVQEAGFKSVQFEGTGLASGVYFYRLQARPSSSSVGGQAGEFVNVKRLLLLK